MQPLNKLGDQFNPSVSLDSQSGKLVISGKSIPLDEQEFLGDITTWLQHYINQPSEITSLEINLEYLNGKLVRSLLRILSLLKQLNDSGGKVNVDWTIPEEAEDLQELSQEVLTDMHIPHTVRLN
jgi:hypothetical protein